MACRSTSVMSHFRSRPASTLVTTILILAMLCPFDSCTAMAAPGGLESARGLVDPIYELSGKLMAVLAKDSDCKNVIMSPLSIHQALSMVLVGSDANSTTRQELLDALGYAGFDDNEIDKRGQDYANVMTRFEQITRDTQAERQKNAPSKDPEEEYSRASSQPKSPLLDLFTLLVTKNQGQLLPDYERAMRDHYHASVSNIDDQKPDTKQALLDRINTWGREAGFGQPILAQNYLDDMFEALLVTAVRVEAYWFDTFGEMEGRNVFYNYGAKDKPVEGTSLVNSDIKANFYEFTTAERAAHKSRHEKVSSEPGFSQLSDLDFRAIKVPLKGDLTFTILEPMPDANGTGADHMTRLNQLAGSLFAKVGDDAAAQGSSKLATALDMLDGSDEVELDYLKMPKFKFESDIPLKEALKSAGLNRMFDKLQAEISGITTKKVYVSDARHRAMIEATKSGIKAAGVTLLKVSMLSATNKPEYFRFEIENPFLFVLRYQKLPLFVGRLTNL